MRLMLAARVPLAKCGRKRFQAGRDFYRPGQFHLRPSRALARLAALLLKRAETLLAPSFSERVRVAL